MGTRIRIVIASAAAWVMLAAGALIAGDLLEGRKQEDLQSPRLEPTYRRCLCPQGNPEKIGGFRRSAWELPATALAADYDTTIHCLVLRFSFQQDSDANTTSNGLMNLSREYPDLYDSLFDSLLPIFDPDTATADGFARMKTDSIYIVRHRHLVDAPPHDSAYFTEHIVALGRYWRQVSEGKIDSLTCDVFPPGRDSVYQLPYPMGHYGRCSSDEFVDSLIAYVRDAVHVADSVSPEIDFSQYGAVFLFHAGSDLQNDIGFPPTCSDLATGFVRLGFRYEFDAQGHVIDSLDQRIPVDGGADTVTYAIIMPETAIQDGRVTALNAVMAHEFGHQLGLIDLYSTAPGRFNTQVGDFALMDNNGFGTSLRFDAFPEVLGVFGTMPIYPCAWSRAYLGFTDVVDLRADTVDVRVTAAELFQQAGSKIIRVPISETEYYLLENRITDTDGRPTRVRFNRENNVIMGPYNDDREFTGEYDLLLPGNPTGGMLIFHVDEIVAALDYDGNGQNNFLDNQLQWWTEEERRFVTLIEGDGLVAFGGTYRSDGFGRAEDMYREDRNHTFTPNSIPPSIDNSGNNTRVYVENIRRDTLSGTKIPDDKVMKFALHFKDKPAGFPVRVGEPTMGRAPIFDDLNGDDTVEVIVTSGQILSAFTPRGGSFLQKVDSCPACPPYYDTVPGFLDAFTSVNSDANGKLHPVPVYVTVPNEITAGPVTGRFPSTPAGEKLVAIGFRHPVLPGFGVVAMYRPTDADDNGRADRVDTVRTIGVPVALAFGDSLLYALTGVGYVYWTDTVGAQDSVSLPPSDIYHGICRLGNALVVMAGNEDVTQFHYVEDTAYTHSEDGFYFYGPVACDLNDDDQPELVGFSPDGEGLYLTVDTSAAVPVFTVLARRATGEFITTNPVIGDVDLDGRPDVVVGGRNKILAFDERFILKTDFPLEVDDRFPEADVIAAPVIGHAESGGTPEVIFPTAVGNVYSFGRERSYGFPVSSGEQRQFYSASSPVLFHDYDRALLGYVGGDGWFYAWQVDLDTSASFWPMNGADPAGSFAFQATDLLPAEPPAAAMLDEDRFYNYPNPVRDGSTRIRYYLGDDAETVSLDIYDLSGERVASLDGTTFGRADNEVVWNCSGITTGVYRCVIKVEFGGASASAYTDIAILK